MIRFEPPRDAITASSPDFAMMTTSRAALVMLIQRYLDGQLDPFITAAETQKLMYFMQETGAPLRLNFMRRHDGPQADNLHPVLAGMDGPLITGYHGGQDRPNRQLELVPGAMKAALAFLVNDRPTGNRIDRVAALINGFETPFGLELLATVHWQARHEHAASPDEIIASRQAGTTPDSRFSPRQITIAYNRLEAEGWLSNG